MTITVDVQRLDPGADVVVWEFDARNIGGDLLRFHGHLQSGPIIWQGEQYTPWPITGNGFERTSDQQPTPKLLVANLDNSISVLCAMFDDLVGAVITRRVTMVKYLDAANFPEGNPLEDPSQEYPPEIWYIERKSLEIDEYVEFELSSPLDYGNGSIPGRQIIANTCPWEYRKEGCAYVGPPVADINDNPTTDPALDRCARHLSSCKLRQWPDGVLNFGGFPAAGLMR